MNSSSVPFTPPYPDSLEWITAYLTVHSLSIPSRRYSLLLWLAVIFVFLTLVTLHRTSSRGGFLAAVWSKWALRRRTWRKKHALVLAQRTNQPHRQPTALPSNAQLLSLAALVLVSFALASIGPDYLAPNLQVWQIQTRSVSPPPPSQFYDMSTFIPLRPQYTIYKSFWSSSARIGQIAFALLPLCVLFALKAPPFAIFALPFMTQIYFDKLAWLHKWAGRLIWLLAAVHVGFWCVQLAKDVNPSTGRIAFVYAWSYTPFIYGWIAFALLTLVILTSLHPIRRQYYEYFHILHLLFVPSMLVMAALHHPTVSWWCWAALAIWFGERLWRGIWWIYTNGVLGRVGPPPFPSNFTTSPQDLVEMVHVHRFSAASNFHSDGRGPSPLEAHYLHGNNHITANQPELKVRIPSSFPPLSEHDLCGIPTSHLPPLYSPPPGYAHAEILSGRTVRIRLITPDFVSWSPGQHFLLYIPSVSRFGSHPFTCASVCDEQAQTDAGRVMEFLVRAKGGWTQTLWNLVSHLTAAQGRSDVFLSDSLPRHGALLRAFVDGPFGSSKRAKWDNYSTAIIVTGGSGVSYGLSLLQYMCMSLSGRDGRYLGGRLCGSGSKGTSLKRVRFIWLIREYSHVQWCASTVRRCMSIIPPSALQVDIYVTNFKPIPKNHSPLVSRFSADFSEVDEELHPPHSSFAQDNSARISPESSESLQSPDGCESDADLSYYLGDYTDDEPPADQIGFTHETNIIDLTNFDGDVDMMSLRDTYLNHRLKKEGKVRRQESYRKSRVEGMIQDVRVSHLHLHSDARQIRQAHDSHDAFPGQYTTPSQLSPVYQSQRTLPIQSTDKLLPPLSEHPEPAPSETDYYSAFSGHSETSFRSYAPPNSVPLSSDLTPTVSLASANGDTRSPRYLAGKPRKLKKPRAYQIPSSKRIPRPRESHSTPISPSALGSNSPLPFEMDEHEAVDISVVSEYARPGKPKLDKVIAHEVQISKGSIVVACCGPRSLNAMVRKIVAAQIDPGRIRKGDMRGSISLMSEEFDY